jgi:hypothetical protein
MTEASLFIKNTHSQKKKKKKRKKMNTPPKQSAEVAHQW